MLLREAEAVKGEIEDMETRRFSGCDLKDAQDRLARLSAQYEEMAKEPAEVADTTEIDAALNELHQKLGRRSAEQYAPKYQENIAETTAKVRDTAVRYKREQTLLKGFQAGTVCPTCRRPVTEKELPAVHGEIRKSAEALLREGKSLKTQIGELKSLEQKTEETFLRFRADDVKTMQAGIEDLERRRSEMVSAAAARNDQRREEMEQMLSDIRSLSAETDCGALTVEEYERLKACKVELETKNAEYAAAMLVVNSEPKDFDAKISETESLIAEKKALIAAAAQYVSKRNELLFASLRMDRVEISLYDVVKSTGEVRNTFRFTYNGRRYDHLSLSEKIRAGMEVSELIKRLTGRNYPQFVDNSESLDDLGKVKPSGQLIVARCVHGAELSIQAKNRPQQLPKAA